MDCLLLQPTFLMLTTSFVCMQAWCVRAAVLGQHAVATFAYFFVNWS